MALFGLWYRSAPAAAETRLAKAHFWQHNIGLPIQMITLSMYVSGNSSVEPVLALVSIVVGIGFACFAIQPVAAHGWELRDSNSRLTD